jgi:hypothetical protein
MRAHNPLISQITQKGKQDYLSFLNLCNLRNLWIIRPFGASTSRQHKTPAAPKLSPE